MPPTVTVVPSTASPEQQQQQQHSPASAGEQGPASTSGRQLEYRQVLGVVSSLLQASLRACAELGERSMMERARSAW